MVPITFMVLAAVSSMKGTKAAARCSSTLAWFGAILFGILIAAGTAQIKVSWLTPKLEMPSYALSLIFLLPASAAVLGEKGRETFLALLLSAAAMTVLSVITIGTLSGPIAAAEPWPFYESAKNYHLFGIAQRFEALVSVGSSLCYFSLFSMLFSVVASNAAWVKEGTQNIAIMLTLGLAMIGTILILGIPEEILVYSGVILWVLWPLRLRLKNLWKKLKKIEKRP